MSEADGSIAADVNPLLWSLLAPVRRFPLARGKGVLVRRLIVPALPADGSFLVSTHGGGKIRLPYRETLGLSTLLYGPFEQAELNYFCGLMTVAGIAMDIGANIGLFSIALGLSAGPKGRVIAIEPLPDNVRRLTENAEMNGLCNVQVHQCAVGERTGRAMLKLADDPAYASTVDVAEHRGTGETISVEQKTLDQIWREEGEPKVDVVKLDVEGGELGVLRGGESLFKSCKPVLLVEANTTERRVKLTHFISHL